MEPLDRPEPMKHPTQTQVYVRWWHPLSYIVDPTQEIILKNYTLDELKLKVNCPMLSNSLLINKINIIDISAKWNSLWTSCSRQGMHT